MNVEFQVGDTVDIEIKGAKVSSVYANCIVIRYGNGLTASLPHDASDVAIVRTDPFVQAGDVWRLNHGAMIVVYSFHGDLVARTVPDSRDSHEVANVDWFDAELLFRLPDETVQGVECGN